MGFKVFQADAINANLLTINAGNQQVLVSGSGDKTTVSLKAPEAGHDPKPAKQSADSVIVFVNEKGDHGRDLIVQWDASSSAAPVSSPRTQPATVATPGPGVWLVTKDGDNIQDSKIDAAYQAVTPSGWQSGASVKFTASNCGLDNFIVTYRYKLSGKEQMAHVVVSVHKRIQCHLFEMRRTAASPATDTISDFRTSLGQAQGVFAGFGIDLVFSKDQIEPEGVTPFSPTLNEAHLMMLVPAAKAAGRKPTDLWINVVNATSGTEDGFGGQSQVFVETKKNLASKAAYETWVTSWQQAKARKVPRDTWVRGYPPDEQKLAREFANEATTPEEVSSLSMKNLMLHEIGHALGLVPTDEKAGGQEQSSWQDPSHHAHCATKTCVMFWSSGSATLGYEGQLRSGAPFDHVPAYMATKNDEVACMLYLRACDLRDLRNLPS